jgi:hypothetical protein
LLGLAQGCCLNGSSPANLMARIKNARDES